MKVEPSLWNFSIQGFLAFAECTVFFFRGSAHLVKWRTYIYPFQTYFSLYKKKEWPILSWSNSDKTSQFVSIQYTPKKGIFLREINKGSFCIGARNLNILWDAKAQSNITLYVLVNTFRLVLLKTAMSGLQGF